MLGFISHYECHDHVTGDLHPDAPVRLEAITNQLIASGMDYVLRHYDAPLVTRADLERVHDAAYLDRVYAMAPGPGEAPVEIDGDTVMSPGTLRAAERAAGAGVLAVDLVMRGDGQPGVLRRAPARPPRGARPGDGVLPVQQHRRRGGARDGRARARPGRDRRFRRPPRQRHRGHLQGRHAGAVLFVVPAPVLPVHRPREGNRQPGRRAAARRRRRRPSSARRSPSTGCRISTASRRRCCSSPPGSTPTWPTTCRRWRSPTTTTAGSPASWSRWPQRHCDGRIVSMLEGGYEPHALARSVVRHLDVLLG